MCSHELPYSRGFTVVVFLATHERKKAGGLVPRIPSKWGGNPSLTNVAATGAPALCCAFAWRRALRYCTTPSPKLA